MTSTLCMSYLVVQLNELMDPESGFLGREGLILRVDVLECCPWFEFADLETYTSGGYLQTATTEDPIHDCALWL